LTVQAALGLLGNVALLAGPAARLIAEPGTTSPIVRQAGDLWGWLSLLAALAVAVCHAGRTLARGGVHVLCLLGLGAGVLLACSAASFDESGTWLAYHVLMATWTLTAVGTLALGWLSSHGRGEDEPTRPLRALP